eukprot:CAMPEP_0114503680 /NCGR_PEP_ID=MMETSP0109-20121206/9782_1 /TAXON_ID=29199 /ORGANISM="Chlorarachnion reptans, Strain CCCM449" /LENGTH=161 /DNA_ID=CAMNT_0001681735 /DNA_START=232 /DNA_END=714 /DNA_ORIENTATION=-
MPTEGGDDFFYPSARSLRNPIKSGWLYKYKSGTCGMCPSWRRRWVVLQGGYLFKFENKDSKKPKGLPISVTESQISIDGSESDDLRKIMRISSIAKQQLFYAEDNSEILRWLSAIQTAKNQAIKQRLGHLEIGEDDAYARRAGETLERTKLVAQQRQRAAN